MGADGVVKAGQAGPLAEARSVQDCPGFRRIPAAPRAAGREGGRTNLSFFHWKLENHRREQACARSEPAIVVLHLVHVTQTDCAWHAREARGDSCKLTWWRVHIELLGPEECQITRQSIAAVHEVFLLVSHSRQLLTSLRL